MVPRLWAEPERMLTIAEAATVLGLTPSTVRADAAAGRIPGARKFGGVWMIPDPPKRRLPNHAQGRPGRPATPNPPRK